jgi:ADP-heptose:LPS heptosyltransferase
MPQGQDRSVFMTLPHKNILVIKLGALGDFIQALGPMAAIRRHHPDAIITLLTTKPYESFALACGAFDRVWTDTKPRWHDLRGWMDLCRRLNENRFTRVYDLQNNDRTALYLRLFHPRPEWVGTAKGASHRNASAERTAGIAFAGHVQTLALVGIHDVTIDNLSWLEGDIRRFHLPERYVLLVPGSAPERPEKRWPAESYGELAQYIDRAGYQPVIVGGPAETEAAKIISCFCPRARDLTGQTTLAEIALLARGATAAVGNDTGPMHIIAATGCRSQVLFSCHSNPTRHAPAGSTVTVIQKDDLAMLVPADVSRNLNL